MSAPSDAPGSGARGLPRPPPALTETRLAAHRLAVYVISPARRRVTGRIGLRSTPGGFGTPVFGDRERVRLDGVRLVRERAGSVDDRAVTSLAEAAAFVLDGPPDIAAGEGFDVPAPGDGDASLALDPAAMDFLAAWFAMAFSALEELRAEGGADASPVQLWPEHFDAAVDHPMAGGRVTFGASPGDAAHPEPYLYVLPPAPPAAPDAVWNATGFRGALLPAADLLEAGDHRAAALAFLRGRRAVIAG